MFKFIGKLIKWTVIGFVALFVVIFAVTMYNSWDEIEANASKAKQDRIEKCIADIGSNNCTDDGFKTQAYKDEQKRIVEEKKAEEKRIAEEEKKAKEAKILAKLEAEKAENKRKGFHCLSSWNGAHKAIVRATEKHLKDPDSFEHIETRVTPVDKNFKHSLYMQYRAKNGFGGMSIGTVVAQYSNTDCYNFTILKIE